MKRTFFECALQNARYYIKFLQSQSRLYNTIGAQVPAYIYIYVQRVIMTCGQCVYIYVYNADIIELR